MKDSRVSVWTNPTTHSTGSTTNTGPTIDLQASGALAGGTSYGTELYGVGFEIIQTNTSGTGQTTVWEFEISSDNSTWRKGDFIALVTLDTASQVYRKKATAISQLRYLRLLATNAGTGTSTSNVYAEDFAGGYPQTFAATA